MFLSFTWAPFVALSGPSYGSPCKKKKTYLANYVSTESLGHCSVQYSTTKNENLGDSQMKMQHWGSWLSIVFIAVKIVIYVFGQNQVQVKFSGSYFDFHFSLTYINFIKFGLIKCINNYFGVSSSCQWWQFMTEFSATILTNWQSIRGKVGGSTKHKCIKSMIYSWPMMTWCVVLGQVWKTWIAN